MKKTFAGKIAAVIIAALIICQAAVTAFAYDVTGGYAGADKYGKNITWSLDSCGVLTLKGDGDMADFDGSSQAAWASSRHSIYSVVIDGDITSIGNRAFVHCTELTDVTVNAPVEKIGDEAFDDCVSLRIIGLPDSLCSVGSDAFRGDEALTGLGLGSLVGHIGAGAFAGCTSLQAVDVNEANVVYSSQDGVLFNEAGTVLLNYPAGRTAAAYTLPATVVSIAARAFENADDLENVTLPEGLKDIGAYAFEYCEKLSTVEIPSGVENIGGAAFFADGALTRANIPAHAVIGSEVFSACGALTAIDADAASSLYNSIDGVLFNKASDELLQYPAGRADTEYKVPGTVSKIGYGAFNCAVKLVSIDLGTAADIENFAFHGCTSLQNIVLPEGLIRVGDNVFNTCSALTDIDIPASVTQIGSGAFYGCSSLGYISLGSSVASVGENAFEGCTSLDTIIINAADCRIAQSPLTIASQATICGKYDSTAEAYADTYGRNFQGMMTFGSVMGTPNTAEPTTAQTAETTTAAEAPADTASAHTNPFTALIEMFRNFFEMLKQLFSGKK